MKEVLEHSGLKFDEIYAVELIGGATRVPKLQVWFGFFICIDWWNCGLSVNVKVHANLYQNVINFIMNCCQ